MWKAELIIIYLFAGLFCIVFSDIKIGVIFENECGNETDVIQNMMSLIAPPEEPIKIKLRINKNPTNGNEYETSKRICNFIKVGVIGIIGPQTKSAATHAMNICDAKEIPYIDTRWDVDTKPPIINMHPHPNALAQVFVDLVKAFEWTTYTILYESGSWLTHVTALLQMYDPKGYTITVRRIDLGLTSNNYRAVLRRVKLSNDYNIVLECSIESLPEILKQAQQVGLLTDYHKFIITNLDMHTIDLEPYQYSGTNITGLRLVSPDNPLVQQFSSKAEEFQTENGAEELLDEFTPNGMTLRTALLFDGIILLYDAIKQLDVTGPKDLNCNNFETWESGNSVLNFMRNSIVNGLTGEIKFDNHGHRTHFDLEVLELESSGIHKVGTYNTVNGLNITRISTEPTHIDDGSLRNKTFIVITALSPPYGMLKDSPLQLTGNDRFEGFGIDLIHELSLMLNFNYIFRLQENGVYGSKNNVTKEWNGMIRELHEMRADLAITDLTITSERESGVDFTMPFMNLGISILYRKPTREPPSTFSFMSPFSIEVWIYLGAAYMGVSLCLFILGRISPSEWDNPYPCIEDPTELENQFSLRNSLWFTIGALLQQGSEIAPKAASTRAVAAIWWFFTLIMVSSYTANLAAFLTVESLRSPISSAEDLKNCGDPSKECPVTFGAKRDGSTINFFKEAEHGTYKSMYQYMEAHPELLTSNNDEGVTRAKEKNYAFLMESSSIEYIIERNCELTQVGNLLDDKGYGIAMRKNSSYRSALSEGVLRLQEQGTLTTLKTRWWKEKKGGGACADSGGDGGAVALEIANVEGVFLLLMIGCALAVFCAFFELALDVRSRAIIKEKNKDDDNAEELDMRSMRGVFYVLATGSAFASFYGCLEWLFRIRSRSKKYEVPFYEELISELKFVAKCSGNTKTVWHRKKSEERSVRSLSQHSISSVRYRGGNGNGEFNENNQEKLDNSILR